MGLAFDSSGNSSYQHIWNSIKMNNRRVRYKWKRNVFCFGLNEPAGLAIQFATVPEPATRLGVLGAVTLIVIADCGTLVIRGFWT